MTYDLVIHYSEEYVKSMSNYSNIHNVKYYIDFYSLVAKGLKELEAYEKSIEEIRNLSQVWEEGAGIKKCLDIIDKHLMEVSHE